MGAHAWRGRWTYSALAVVLAICALPGSGPAWAHGKEAHAATKAQGERPADPAPIPPTEAGLPFGLDIGEGFEGLIDAKGAKRSLADFRGRHVLLFFGYANCEAICSAALPDMARAVDLIGADAKALLAVMITVDPERDRPAEMGAALAKISPRLYGLTGSEEALASAREAFRVETSQVGTDWFGKPIFSHGSFLYLIGPTGALETLLPPVLGAETMAAIIKKYL